MNEGLKKLKSNQMNTHLVLVLVLLFQTVQITAQNISDFASLVNPSTIRQHVEVLASDSIAGRETAEPGMQKAVYYVEKQFKSVGLKPAFGSSFRQEVPFVKWNANAFTVAYGKQGYVAGKDFYMTPSAQTNQIFVSSKAFWVCAIDTLPTQSELPKHGVVLLLTSHVKNITNDSLNNLINASIKKLSELKPVAILVERDFSGEREKRQIRRMDSGMLSLVNNDKSTQPPVCYISPAVYRNLKKSGKHDKKSIGPVIHTKDSFTISVNGYRTTCYNVGGVLPGGDNSDEYIVVTAHLDHLGKRDTVIYYGADDDGSGCAAVMNLASAFTEAKRQGIVLKRSILFLLFTGEEKGLLGSTYFTENPPISMAQTVANLNIDMIGRVDTVSRKDNRYVYLIGSDKMSKDLHLLSETTNNSCCQINLDYTYNNESHPMRLYYRSDHYSFVKKGVPAIFYFTGLHDDYHKPTDTADKLDYVKTASISQLIFSTAWELANRPTRITVDQVR